ncbi:hypothetical protein BRADI_3g15809v3 [Brachypodium distachyon]|uniref:DJ-1/PfpI domain-containing protein n=1 Tax=Brachypodium distachyon TaxID=15368 RepID=A0A2K2CXD6_BRADI|nr:hypothetical protein BRADI_3g15809v3 [Brachypodium distachyon]
MAAVAPAPAENLVADGPVALPPRDLSWSRSLFFSGAAAGEPAKRVLGAVAAGTEPLEAAATADVLNRAGASVTVATVKGLVVKAAQGVRFVADGRVGDLESEEFDLIALPVGPSSSPHATCYPPLMSRFGDDGGIPMGSRVVVDRNVVTSQGVGTAIEFGLALVEQLYGKGKMEEVAGPLYVRPQQGVDYIIHEYNPIQWKCNVPVANGSEEMEALNQLVDILRRAGANVTVASVEDTPRIVTRHQKLGLVADVLIEEAAEMQFDLIVMPGGLPGARKFAGTDKLVRLLKNPTVYSRLGKKATPFPPMAHLLKDRSACEYRVVVDGNVITSKAPGSATEFALAIVHKLFGREKAVVAAKDLVFM